MKKKYVIVLVYILLVILACEKERPGTVATVGKNIITFDELKESLALEPMYSTKVTVRKARNSQMKHLVQDVWYFLAAQKVALDKDSVIQQRMDYIRKSEIKRAFIENEVLDKVKISDTELVQGFTRAGRQLKIRHLFFRDSLLAVEALKKLRRGTSFFQLAGTVFQDSSLRNNGGELGYVSFGDMDPRLEDAAYALNPGEVSSVVRSAYGYHILRVDSVRNNAQFTALNLAMQNETVKKTLQSRHSHEIMSKMLQRMAGDAKIRINNKTLKALSTIVEKELAQRYGQPSLLKPPVRTSDLVSIEQKAMPFYSMELASFKGKTVRVGDFLERLHRMPPFHRPYLKGIKRVAEAVMDMVRDELIVESAMRQGYARKEKVKERIDKETRRLLATEFKRRYFSNNFKTTDPGKWEQLDKTLQQIKKDYPPRINEAVLFQDVPDPDRSMAPPAVPVFIKSRYLW